MLLIRRFVVDVAGRKHHPFDTQIHHLVEKLTDTFRFGAVEKRGVGGHAEAAIDGQPNSFHGLVVGALAAHREIMVLALAVHVDDE